MGGRAVAPAWDGGLNTGNLAAVATSSVSMVGWALGSWGRSSCRKCWCGMELAQVGHPGAAWYCTLPGRPQPSYLWVPQPPEFPDSPELLQAWA